MQSHFTTLDNGLRIHYLAAGAEENPPLILLHGYPVTAQLWRHIIPPLAERFRIYAPDLPGHGGSDKPLDVDYDLDYLVRFVAGFYDALGLERAGLICHDLGGMAGLGFAARHPQRVGQFVVMDTAPYADWTLFTRLVIGMASKPFCTRLMLWPPMFKGVMRFIGVHRPAALTSEILGNYLASWTEDQASRLAFSRVIAIPPERMVEPRQNLRRIAAPTLILWAENDRLFPLDVARRLQEDIPNARLVTVPDCGHFLQEEQPDQVVAHLLSFLDSAKAL